MASIGNPAWSTTFFYAQDLRSLYMNGLLANIVKPGIYNPNMAVFAKDTSTDSASNPSNNSILKDTPQGLYLYIKKGTTFIFSNNYRYTNSKDVVRDMKSTGSFIIKSTTLDDTYLPIDIINSVSSKMLFGQETTDSQLDYEAEKEVFVKNMLFATLDVTLRKATLPNKRDFLVVDTVGFVSKLPHDLVNAFKATLEEVQYADLILHVIDATNSSYELQKQTTESVLKDLDVDDKKTIIVYNKVDKLELDIYPKNQKDKVYISAKKGINMDKLLKLIEEALMEDTYEVSLLLPYDRGDIFSKIKDKYNVNNFNYEENGISVDVNLDEEDYNIYKDYIIK